MSSTRIARASLAIIAAAALLAACAANPPPPGSGRTVRIERTSHGVAHITAADQEGIGYGAAYAQAQDNVCQTAQQLVTVRGERSLHFGSRAMGLFGLRLLTNEQIDLFVRSHMDDEALAKANAAASADARAAMRGYVAGFNRYLRDVGPGGLPPECRNAAWVKPMTVAELWRLNEESMVLGGVGAFVDAVVAAVPPGRQAEAGSAITPALSQREKEQGKEDVRAVLAEYGIDQRPDGELGSNGWAFGKGATPDGFGVSLGNPHFPWYGVNRFWQMHLTIPGQLDVMGAATGSSPAVQIGFNRDVAWTHTVSTGKRFTLYELTLDPADPTSYIVDGQRRRMQAHEVNVPVPAGAAPVKHTFYRTHWGPIVVVPRAGLTWSTAKAYAIADANTFNPRATDTWMRMNRARSVQELRDAMGHQGLPWVNTIAADRAGHAMYADLSVVPDVPAAMLQRCAPSPQAAALFAGAGLPVLDGSRSDCAWQRDTAAAAPGLTPPSRMPVVITDDWVANSNDSFWLANPRIAAPQVSPLVGPVGTPQRLRTRSGILEIESRLAGTDGLPGHRMGIDEARQLIFRDRNLAGMLVLPDLLAACHESSATLSPAQREGCAALARWDRTSNAGAAGAPLFREFWRKARGIPNVWRVPFDRTLPVTTPAGLKLGDAAVRTAVFQALEEAVGILKAAGYPVDVALAQVQFRDVRGQRVAIHGGDEFEGVLNKVEAQGQPQLAAGGYRINYGASYIQAVTFDARGPVAYGLLTYGQSSSAASPHSFDQLPLFSAKQWPRLPFHPEDVSAQRIAAPMVLGY